jgi:hypothetical protein
MVRPIGRLRRVVGGLTILPFAAAAIIASGGTAPATGGRAIRADDLIYFFDEIALSQQEPSFGRRPKWVRRWPGDVSVRVIGSAPAGFGKSLSRALAQISDWTGQRFALATRAQGRAGITIRIVPHAAMVARYGEGGHVCTTLTLGRTGRLHTARIEISDQYTDCLDHELMHALGFDGHWFARDLYDPIRTVLALRSAPGRRFRFTRFDAMAIRMLYHRRLAPGMARQNALAHARRLFRPPPQL